MHEESRVCPKFCHGDGYEVSCTVFPPPRKLSVGDVGGRRSDKVLVCLLKIAAFFANTFEDRHFGLYWRIQLFVVVMCF